nr:PREDICTED: uncharacterized protein LOC107079868 [Lepisosteus oculatus]XP_015222529.1 PREDICTED: uncharacterized protein LOC107079868 [Lepisosteus oculatus]XP_015222530.1 PREDICTED: uncharacterized protein LOC107079868 [Lepisosteus oculatus]
MASSTTRCTWCPCRKHKIPSKDTHELCLHCLGIQHAKEAVLEYGKCPHCAKLDWSTCINRLTKVQEVIHRESQQKKSEAAQSEPVKPADSSQSGDPKIPKELGPAQPPVTPFAAAAVPTSALPVMLTILSPPPAQPVSSPSLATPVHVAPVADQQPGFSPSPAGQPSGSHKASCQRKRRRSSECHSRCSRHSKRGHGYRCRKSPCFSSSSPHYSSSSDSSRPSTRKRRSWFAAHTADVLRKQQEQLLEGVRQRLEAQQQTMHLQWSLLEKRLEALEKKQMETPPKGATGGASAPGNSDASTSTPEGRRDAAPDPARKDWSGPAADGTGTTASGSAPVKEEEEPALITAGVKLEDGGDGEGEDVSLLPEVPLTMQELLMATELQGLISRAARYLGIDFPGTPNNLTSPDPTMVPEFENLVQSTWSNPACSRPFRAVHSKMYRLHECQALPYDRMPQVNRFMSAIFQAVKPTENKEALAPARRWRFTETLAERVYQTAGMLARTANYLRYLSDYQKRLLVEITEDKPAVRFVAVLNELKLIAQFTLQLSSHQAELSGRIMASSVAIRRQVWMAKTSYTDALKATVADLPFVVSHTFGAGAETAMSDIVCKQELR